MEARVDMKGLLFMIYFPLVSKVKRNSGKLSIIEGQKALVNYFFQFLVYLKLRFENREPIKQVTAESAVFVIVLMRHFAVFVFIRGQRVNTRRLE